MSKSNLAYKQEYSEITKGISMSGLSVLEIINNSTEVEALMILDNYWRARLQNATNENKSEIEAELKRIERILIARSILIEDILNASQLTNGISSMEPEVVKTEDKKETTTEEKGKVIDISTKKEIKEKPKAEVKTETKPEEKKIDIVDALKTEEPKLKISSKLGIGTLRGLTIDLIKAGQKEKAEKEAFAAFSTGNYIPKEGKKVHNWKEAEFNGWIKGILAEIEKGNNTEVVKTESTKTEETKDESVSTLAPEITAPETKPVEEVVKTPEELLKEEYELNKAVYKHLYGTEDKFENFGVPHADKVEEEKAFVEFAKHIINLSKEGDDDKYYRILDLFFSRRGYAEAQKYSWANAVFASKGVVDNHLTLIDSLKVEQPKKTEEKVEDNFDPKKQIETLGGLFDKGKELIEVKKWTQNAVLNWFEEQVIGRVIDGMNVVIENKASALTWFNNMFSSFFRKDEPSENKIQPQTVEEIIRLLQTADAKTDSVSTIAKKAKDFCVANNLHWSLKEVTTLIKKLAKEHNKEIDKKFEKILAEAKLKVGEPVKTETVENTEVKKEESSSTIKSFNTLDWVNTMVNQSFFDTPKLREIVKELAAKKNFKEASDFLNKAVEEGRTGSYFTKTTTEIVDGKTISAGLVKFTKEELDNWIKETIAGVEDATIVDEPKTEPIEATATTESTKEEVKTEEATVETAEIVEPENVDENPNFAELKDAVDRKNFESAVGKLLLRHGQRKTLHSEIISALKTANGKYSKRMGKNSEKDLHNSINKIRDNMKEVGLITDKIETT